jgi:hypothetical protein
VRLRALAVDARRGVARRGSFCAACGSADGEDAGVGRGVARSGVRGLGRGWGGGEVWRGVGGGCRGWLSTEGVGWVGVASRVRRAVVSTAEARSGSAWRVTPKLVSYGVRTSRKEKMSLHECHQRASISGTPGVPVVAKGCGVRVPSAVLAPPCARGLA